MRSANRLDSTYVPGRRKQPPFEIPLRLHQAVDTEFYEARRGLADFREKDPAFLFLNYEEAQKIWRAQKGKPKDNKMGNPMFSLFLLSPGYTQMGE